MSIISAHDLVSAMVLPESTKAEALSRPLTVESIAQLCFAQWKIEDEDPAWLQTWQDAADATRNIDFSAMTPEELAEWDRFMSM